ncbi:nitrite reductase [NAD(P)H] small subunit [Oryzomicrobium terrae]|uniref:Nitrite reductase, [NAD(P)H] small subunit n=2 Tax=Oryzomicrobium terrae TaxID=1735038 RepID=A0A5C1E772_9RHOO|nr:nitrite reductase [NAD(P)H] small subunit [Oryzomicrobium terrae]
MSSDAMIAVIPAPAAATGQAAPEWKRICRIDEIPPLGSRVVKPQGKPAIAVFRTADDRVFALHDHCPHKGGPLSQGIVHGTRVTCPLHGWNIGLDDGQAVAPDVGHCGSFAVKVEAGVVWLAV